MIIENEAIAFLKSLDSLMVDCIFTDPPYNIGLQYENHDDNMSNYYDWCNNWIYECSRVLKPGGSFWLVINDEHVCRLALMLERMGMVRRNHIIWFYTFGPHCESKFTRAKAHILYFTRKGGKHTWNRPLVPSARQAMGDKRAAPEGKTPDDVWEIPRLVGNAKERVKYPCQLPLELVNRAILCSTNVGDTVLDPFLGTGTTAVSALTHKRKIIGCDNSPIAIGLTHGRIANLL